MTPFMGTHTNKRDSKGRISLPAAFRAALRGAEDGAVTVVLRPSHKHPCIEGWPLPVFHALGKPLERFDLFSDDQEDLTAELFANACQLEADKEGRIVLPESLVTHANIGETAEFMGLNHTFQIWEPDAAARRRAEVRQRVLERRLTLPAGVA